MKGIYSRHWHSQRETTMTIEREEFDGEIKVTITGEFSAGFPDTMTDPGEPDSVEDIHATDAQGNEIQLTDEEMKKAEKRLLLLA